MLMDYGKLLNRAWQIIWEHKFLIILGVLVALSSGLGTGTSSGTNFRFEADSQDLGFGSPPLAAFSDAAIPFWLALFLVGLGLIAAFVLWVISTLARGGLIAGAAAANGGQNVSFSQAWNAGWKRGWTLLGIGIVPAIPGLVLLFLGGLGFWAYVSNASTSLGIPAERNVALILVMLACLAIPAILVLEILRVFANRACMLEGLGVVDAYRRGVEILVDNLGSALVLFLMQIVATVVMIILLIVPVAVLALCCLFWPVLLLLQGAVTAYFSTMWTLAWQEWTGKAPVAVESLAA
jgi:hypothetical protein